MGEIYIINDLSESKKTMAAPKGAKMGASMTQILTFVKMLSKVDWLDIKRDISLLEKIICYKIFILIEPVIQSLNHFRF